MNLNLNKLEPELESELELEPESNSYKKLFIKLSSESKSGFVSRLLSLDSLFLRIAKSEPGLDLKLKIVFCFFRGKSQSENLSSNLDFSLNPNSFISFSENSVLLKPNHYHNLNIGIIYLFFI